MRSSNHERCLGLDPGPDENKLARLSQCAVNAADLERRAVAAARALGALPVAAPGQFAAEAGFLAFLSARLPELAGRVLARYPQPDDLFAGYPDGR